MPTKEEIDALVDDKSTEVTKEVEKKTVSEEDYKDAVAGHGQIDYEKQYKELRKLEAKREKELHELREKAKLLDAVQEDEEEDGPKGLTEEQIQKKIDEGIAQADRARSLQITLQSAVSKYQFVDEAETLAFIKEKGGKLTVQEAITLKYPNELLAYQRSHSNDDISESDSGGRTITTKQNDSEERGELKQGFPIRAHDDNGMQRFIGKRITENLKKISGQR